MTQKETKEARLFSLIKTIRPADGDVMRTAKARWDSIAKPIGGLGVLEEDIIKIAGIRNSAYDLFLKNTALAVMCADHGVVEEGVTQTGQDVTGIVADNFTKGQTSVAIMCRVSGTDIFPVDMGILGDMDSSDTLERGKLLDRKVARGSKNIVREAAMTRDQCVQAVLAGIDLAGQLKEMGYDVLATGEMGIGNTTPASALAAAVTGWEPELVTGRGAGLSDQGLERKRQAVGRSVKRFFEKYPGYMTFRWQEECGKEDALTLLSELGGFDIAGMTGLFLGAAIYRIPAVIDGYISSVAALLSVLICRNVTDFLLASHLSSEPAGRKILDMMGLSAPLNCGMHLGEGSGAVALIPLLKMGAEVYERMSTFDEIQIESYVDYSKTGGQE